MQTGPSNRYTVSDDDYGAKRGHTFWGRDTKTLLQNTCEVCRARSVPKQETFSILQVIMTGFVPRVRLLLPFHAVCLQEVSLDVMCCTMRVTHVGFQSAKLSCMASDGLHAGETERAEVSIHGVERIAVLVLADRARDKFGGDFL